MRGCDSQGCGYFGAPRGRRKHNGIDLLCDPETMIQSPIEGIVTKIGYPYGDSKKRHIRYIQVSRGNYNFRVFYINPAVRVGQRIRHDTIIGHSQSLAEFYPGISEHVHLEIKNSKGQFIDPTPVILSTKDHCDD